MNIENAYEIILNKVEEWLHDLVAMLPNLVTASIVLVLGLFAARYLKKLFFKGISRVVEHKNLAGLSTSIFHLILIGIVVFATLSILKLDRTVTTILAGAGVLGLALAFAFQDIAANFVSGVFIATTHPFKPGETIKSKDHTGVVQNVNLRDTTIVSFQGQVIRIPNKEIFQNPLINFTRLGRRRLDLEVGVSYSADLEKVERVALEAIRNVSVLSKEAEPRVYFKQFDNSSIILEMKIWFHSGDQPTFDTGRSEVVKLIKKAFDANGISIPFPVRVVEMKQATTSPSNRDQ